MSLPLEGLVATGAVLVVVLLAGLAWQMGRAVDRRDRSMRALLAVSRLATANLDRQQMLATVVQAVQDDMGYSMASVLMLDDDQRQLESVAISSNLIGRIPLGDRVAIGRGMVGAAARTGQTQCANDVAKNIHYARVRQGQWDPGSEISVPLKSGERVIGVFDVQDLKRNAFTQDDLRILEALAEQIVVILDKARSFEQERRRAERMATLTRTSRLLAGSLSLDVLLNTSVEAINTHLHFAHVALLLVDPQDPKTLVLGGRSGVYDASVPGEYRQSIHQGVIGRAARTGQPVLVNAVEGDPDYIPVPGQQLGCELALPIKTGDRLLGVLNIEDSTPFSNEDVDSLKIITDQLAVAIDNARLYERSQTVAALEERQRLARDLHDSVTQLLFSITLVAQTIGPAYQHDPREGEERVARLLRLSQQALSEMRALLTELRAESVIGDGLLSALHRFRDRLSARSPIHIVVQAPAYRPQAVEVEEALYRIVQESLNNVSKHAGATRVTVTLDQPEGWVALRVCDDGRGFDPNQVRPGALGLVGMRERVERLGGRLTVETRPGAGTTVVARIPQRPARSR
jgi:signal transduction histidine kinase